MAAMTGTANGTAPAPLLPPLVPLVFREPVPSAAPHPAPVPDISPDKPAGTEADTTPDTPEASRRQDAPVPAQGTADRPAAGTPLMWWRGLALKVIATLIAVASGASFAESYRGLFDWAHRHGLSGFWAAAFPLQVDVFIAVGELALFVAMVDRWKLRHRAGAWLVTLLGLAVSVAGNIGHIASPDIQSRATAAVPPLAAFAALWVGLTVLKRVVSRDNDADREQDRTADSSTDKTADTKRPRKRWRPRRRTDRTPDTMPDTTPDTNPDNRPDKTPRRRGVRPDKVSAAIKRHPDWDDDKIATSCGVSTKTVKRRRTALAKAESATGAAS